MDVGLNDYNIKNIALFCYLVIVLLLSFHMVGKVTVSWDAIGIMGEYLGRLFIESKRRPLYIIAEHKQTKKG